MSYKKKNIVLLIIILTLLYLSWSIAIKETLLLANEIKSMQTELEKIENAPNEITQLEIKLNKIKGQSDNLYSSILEIRKELLSEISLLANKYNVTLKSFPDYHLQKKEGIELTTSPVILSGSFKSMVKLIDDFEKRNNLGKVSSAKFEVKESARTKRRTLYLTLFVQSINL